MKKIGEIKGVPVVEGNINEVTKNQIHYKEDSGSIQLSKRGNDNKLNSVTGSSSDGSSSKYAPRYFSIDFEKANGDWGKLMTIDNDVETFKIAASYKYFNGCECIIAAYGYPETNSLDPYSFSYVPLYISQQAINALGLNNVQGGFKSLEEIISIINILAPKVGLSIDISMEGITEITEEEYYKID